MNCMIRLLVVGPERTKLLGENRDSCLSVIPENSSAKILIWTLRVAQLTLASLKHTENVKNFRILVCVSNQ